MLPVEIEKKARELRKKIAEAKPEYAPIKGTTYYVSADGDDANDGLSPETAWKTLDAPNNHSGDLKPGDAVLFRCGDVFTTVKPRKIAVKMAAGVTYSSFGEGPKPELCGTVGNAAELDWKQEDENLYSIEIDHELDIGAIYFDFAKEWGLKKVKGIHEDYMPSLDLEFFHDVLGRKLYLYSEKGNPKERWQDIKLAHYCIILNCVLNDVVIDNLAFRYIGAYGIEGAQQVIYPEDDACFYYGLDSVTVVNCEFEWIGGSLTGPTSRTRLGNGFEIWGGGKNLIVKNCYFNQIYDAALTQQWRGALSKKNTLPVTVEDSIFSGNLFENNTYDYEYFLTELEYKGGPLKADSQCGFKNVYFENNICRKNGLGWGNQRPDRYTASSLKSWSHQNRSENLVFRNNIFDRGDYRLIEINARDSKHLAILSGNVYCQHLGKVIISSNGNTSVMTDEVAKTQKISNGEENAVVTIARW